jgi:hypothetical protein
MDQILADYVKGRVDNPPNTVENYLEMGITRFRRVTDAQYLVYRHGLPVKNLWLWKTSNPWG